MKSALHRCQGNGYGFCDSEGKQITPCIYDQVKTNEYFNAFKIAGLWGFIDETGKCIQEAQFRDILFIGRFVVADNHIYDSKFDEYLPVENITKIKPINSCLLLITDKDEKMYVFSTKTEQLVETIGKCDDILQRNGFLVCVKGENETDIIDEEDLELMQKITDLKFISCEYAGEGYLFVLQQGDIKRILYFFHHTSNTFKIVLLDEVAEDIVNVDWYCSQAIIVTKCKFKDRYRMYNVEFDSNIIKINVSSTRQYYISFTRKKSYGGLIWCGLLENEKIEMIYEYGFKTIYNECSIKKANKYLETHYRSGSEKIRQSDFDRYMLKD